jgi:DNA invertase Pin-like site-specific DNA recombinase
MATGTFIAYFRVSTARQGRSGLGLEAQRKAVLDYLNGGAWTLAGEFTEIESGKRSDRPELAKALSACRAHKATLVIAKLDRLARDAHFLLGLQKAGVEFVATDLPQANRMTIGIMAMVAEEEGRAISARTRAALAAAKARGTVLGGARGDAGGRGREFVEGARAALSANAEARAADLAPIIADIQAAGVESHNGIARALNERGVPTARGKTWSNVQVSALLERLARRKLQ